MPGRDYYEILGCSPDASPGELKRAYRKRALASHPDKNPTDPDAGARFREVRKAWTVLSDASKRLAYDNTRRQRRTADFDTGVGSHYRPYFPSSGNNFRHGAQRRAGARAAQPAEEDSSDEDEDDEFGSFDAFRREFAAHFFDDEDDDDGDDLDNLRPMKHDFFGDEHRAGMPLVRFLACALGAGFAAVGILWSYFGNAGLLFPAALYVSNHDLGSLPLNADFRLLTIFLKQEHIKRSSAWLTRGITGSLLTGSYGLRTYSPYLRVQYNASDLVPIRPMDLPNLPHGAMLLRSHVHGQSLTPHTYTHMHTYVAPALEDDKARPTRWPPGSRGRKARDGTYAVPELCVRLLRSGTISSKPWFRALRGHENLLGPQGRLRTFGFSAVRSDECKSTIGVPTIGVGLLAGYLSAKRMGSL